ncbi:MAG TPA: hypothetical protein VF281_04590 [Candidatus Saccharimonadales bacterium]
MPRPVDRRTVAPEPIQRQPEAPQPVHDAPKTVQQPAAPHHVSRVKKSSKKRFTLPIIVILIIVLGILGWFAWSKMHAAGPAIDSGKYQAVFFTNGQVYFGKLQSVGGDYMKLTDIYYLQTQTGAAADSSNPQQTTTDQSNVQLIKLGEEIHGPEDQMVIVKDQVLFYENLKADGKVAKSIDQYKKSH